MLRVKCPLDGKDFSLFLKVSSDMSADRRSTGRLFHIRTMNRERPHHQTEIVHGAHPVAGARIAYTRAMSEH